MSNIAASVMQRLRNEAKRSDRPFEELYQYYCIERFLYRLSQSKHHARFVLKGALMLMVWDVDPPRATRDIDLLGFADNNLDMIGRIVREVCEQKVEPDGVTFDPAMVLCERIAEHAEYEGVRVALKGNVGNAEVNLRLDIGFGDAVIPEPAEIDYPTVLDFPRPTLRGYTRESVIAEKVEAMVRLSEINSRMKDFYDVWALSRQFDFSGDSLLAAVKETFQRRGTTVEPNPLAISPQFATDERQRHWKAFTERQRLNAAPGLLLDVIRANAVFLQPVLQAVATQSDFNRAWTGPGPWR